MWCFIVAFDRHCGQAFCPLSPQLIEAINYPDRPRQLLPAFLSSRTGPCPLRTAGPNSIGILWITGNPHADGKHRLLVVLRKKIANPVRYQCSSGHACLRQYKRKFVPAMACCGVDSAAAVPQDLSESAERSIPRQMTKLVVSLLQAIEVPQYQREFSSGSL